MNAITLTVPSNLSKSKVEKVPLDSSNQERHSIFNGLLQQQTAGEQNSILLDREIYQQLDEPLNNESLIAQLQALTNPNEPITEANPEELEILNELQTITGLDISTLIEQLITQQQTEPNMNKEATFDQRMMTNLLSKLESQTTMVFHKEGQFQQLIAKFEQLVSKLSTNNDNLLKLSPKILQVLHQWTVLEKKLTTEQMGILQQTLDKDSNEQTIFKEILHAFKNRNELAAKQHYRANAQVTSTDVAKWLHALTTNKMVSNHPQVIPATIPYDQSMPMSTVEQLVIHVHKGEGAVPAEQQLLKQFQQAIRSSQFLSLNNGTTHLSFSLRPQNLGEMVVRLTQMNGEMAVKIIVTSQVAKEMMESNIHQLKNMFAPHQVVIEKEDLVNGSRQDILKEAHDEQTKEQEKERSESDPSEDNEDQANKDFKTEFLEQIMNEKV
ncbi:flagellar hook-length control protein FliK [Virgibacillus sp. W0181]|uniref:flagellar hook-length control protein FliK n=1 Tax=Virgibacillus sp. W0181 TaxID=3391581 RepID=UPI003F48E0EC